MKVCVLSDTHFGVRNDNKTIQDNQFLMLDKLFFPVLKKLGVTDIIHMGDLFDKRRNIDVNTLKRTREHFLGRLQDENIRMRVVLGNHDVYYKNTNSVNSVRELTSEFSMLDFVGEPVTKNIFDDIDHPVLFLPWINDENRAATEQAIADTTAPVVFGHLELTGFEFHRGVESTHGDDPESLKKFRRVYTGHFHHPSAKGNVRYLGAPYEMTWSDAGGKRGFHIYDTETGSVKFVPNPYTLFVRAVYDDSTEVPAVSGKYVRVTVEKKTSAAAFDDWLAELHSQNPEDIKIIEPLTSTKSIDTVDSAAQDTKTILANAIDGMETDVPKEQLKKLMFDVYTEALETMSEIE